MAAADAQTFWMSASIPNDQFALYVFAGVPDDLPGGDCGPAPRGRARVLIWGCESTMTASCATPPGCPGR